MHVKCPCAYRNSCRPLTMRWDFEGGVGTSWQIDVVTFRGRQDFEVWRDFEEIRYFPLIASSSLILRSSCSCSPLILCSSDPFFMAASVFCLSCFLISSSTWDRLWFKASSFYFRSNLRVASSSWVYGVGVEILPWSDKFMREIHCITKATVYLLQNNRCMYSGITCYIHIAGFYTGIFAGGGESISENPKYYRAKYTSKLKRG